jgi:hypothetical protein
MKHGPTKVDFAKAMRWEIGKVQSQNIPMYAQQEDAKEHWKKR